MNSKEAHSTGLTGHELTDRLHQAVVPLGKVAYWEHTGGNCACVVVGESEKFYRADEGAFLMSPGPDVYSFDGDGQNPISDSYEEQWDHFSIGHYAPDPGDPNDHEWWCISRHWFEIEGDGFGAGLEALAAAVAEWSISGSITGWKEGQ